LWNQLSDDRFSGSVEVLEESLEDESVDFFLELLESSDVPVADEAGPPTASCALLSIEVIVV